MRIGIIGTGDLGLTLAELWSRAGHQVLVAASETELAPELVGQLSEMRADVVPADDAAREAEVVALTGPFGNTEAFPSSLTVVGKVVIDAMNAGPEDDAGASSEAVAERYPHARVVKALNTLPAELLRVEGRRSAPKEQRLAVVLSGDDARAKARVSTLIEEIGFSPVDAGSLAHGGELQQPGSDIFGKPMLPAEARMALSLSR